jgi:hypothetical protein
MIDASNPNFNLAKQYVIHGINKQKKFAIAMDIMYATCGFRPYVQKLTKLECIIQNAWGPCVSSNQIDVIEKFALHLSSNRCSINSYFTRQCFLSKLHQFWNLRQTIISITGKTEEIILWRLSKKDIFQNKADAFKVSIKRAHQVKKTTDLIVNAISNKSINIHSIMSILLILVIRVEAHEYEIENMIGMAKNYVNLNYDIPEMCSVTSKVQKGKDWRSDTRAIRDAISHAHFSVDYSDKGYKIHFQNSEDGYSFDKAFTEEELLLFYQDYDRLIAVQTLLLNSALTSDFLRRQFKI